jgi:hypothetical protein
MGRAYAGILGPLAFALLAARGVGSGWGAEPTLLAAIAALFVFAALGYVTGQLADYLVNQSVRTQFNKAMADWNEKQTTPTPSPSGRGAG